ncbi:acyl-CoA thioesterase [Streptomyces longwoodensis]|uniref:AmcD n=1 Tax=Streptomyces novoguineensis TaxID=2586640 RepID=A0A4Y5QSJ6_9ACTN|nr:AmcD [Streptomyces novoguineensis]QHW08542.1 thioesterase [Streptomyces novoguineensis]BBE52698.1 thioesterase [Streptomyces sp.]
MTAAQPVPAAHVPGEWTEVRRRAEHVDTDASGVVHFSRYASWLETAVLENLDRVGAGLGALAPAHLDLAVVELRMHYHAPVRFLDRVRVHARVERVGPARVQVSGEITREDAGGATRCASGSLLLGAVHLPTGAPALLPEDVRTTLEECSVRAQR